LYEGVVFCHLSHIQTLRAAGGQFSTARLTGGGSRSQVWTQMFADTIGVPMEVCDGTELGARGAALSAGIGTGIYHDYSEAVAQAVKVVRVQEPDSCQHPALFGALCRIRASGERNAGALGSLKQVGLIIA
jgi:L-xylulokinase